MSAKINIYASNKSQIRKRIREERIRRRNGSSRKLRCVTSDFNSIRGQHERPGIQRRDSQNVNYKMFNDFIEDMKLIDLLLVGRKFTWFKPNERLRSITKWTLSLTQPHKTGS